MGQCLPPPNPPFRCLTRHCTDQQCLCAGLTSPMQPCGGMIQSRSDPTFCWQPGCSQTPASDHLLSSCQRNWSARCWPCNCSACTSCAATSRAALSASESAVRSSQSIPGVSCRLLVFRLCKPPHGVYCIYTCTSPSQSSCQ